MTGLSRRKLSIFCGNATKNARQQKKKKQEEQGPPHIMLLLSHLAVQKLLEPAARQPVAGGASVVHGGERYFLALALRRYSRNGEGPRVDGNSRELDVCSAARVHVRVVLRFQGPGGRLLLAAIKRDNGRQQQFRRKRGECSCGGRMKDY